jgi:hypothetical protein
MPRDFIYFLDSTTEWPPALLPRFGVVSWVAALADRLLVKLKNGMAALKYLVSTRAKRPWSAGNVLRFPLAPT